MKLTLEVNKVIPGSFEKNGKIFETLDVLCTDKSDGERLDHSVLFSPLTADQRELLRTRNIRDMRIVVEVTQIKTNFSGAVVLKGSVDPASLPAANVKLPVTKPGN